MKVYIILEWDGADHLNHSCYRHFEDMLTVYNKLRAESKRGAWTYEEWDLL